MTLWHHHRPRVGELVSRKATHAITSQRTHVRDHHCLTITGSSCPRSSARKLTVWRYPTSQHAVDHRWPDIDVTRWRLCTAIQLLSHCIAVILSVLPHEPLEAYAPNHTARAPSWEHGCIHPTIRSQSNARTLRGCLLSVLYSFQPAQAEGNSTYHALACLRHGRRSRTSSTRLVEWPVAMVRSNRSSRWNWEFGIAPGRQRAACPASISTVGT